MLVIESAARAKALLANKLMYQSGHEIVCTEISEFNNPDILSLTRSGKLIEYEIKISKADLMGELNSVKTCVNAIMIEAYNRPLQGAQQMMLGDKPVNAHIRGNVLEPESLHKEIGKCSKLDKHERYLLPKPSKLNAHGYYQHPYRPNQFYFAVTQELVGFAVEACKGTPYGVIDLNALYGSGSIKARAGTIHGEEASKLDIWRMAHSLSYGYWKAAHQVTSPTTPTKSKGE